MTTAEVLAIVIAIVNLVAFYAIIRAAVASGTETRKRMKHMWAQTELLIAIARKFEVEEDTIAAITRDLGR
ncbi:MAG: hypothetical protein AB7O24_34260 [Kofleriaceae bacterium]